jgi:hypothetical protein
MARSGVPINKRTVTKQFVLFFSLSFNFCRTLPFPSRRIARPGLLAGPTWDTLQSYVTLARLALTSTSIGYRHSRRDRCVRGRKNDSSDGNDTTKTNIHRACTCAMSSISRKSASEQSVIPQFNAVRQRAIPSETINVSH